MKKKSNRRIRSLSTKHLQAGCWSNLRLSEDALMRQEFIEECKVVGTGKKPVVVDIKTADGTPAWTYLKSGTVVTPELQQNLQALHDQIIAPYSKKANERIVKEIQEIYKQRNPQKGNQ